MTDKPKALVLADLWEYREGGLYWKIGGRNMSIGSRAGSLGKDGYRRVRYMGKAYKEHRVIFLMHHGYLPPMLDHINGIRDDNRIENLRPANHAENNSNSVHANTSGVKGVSWYAPRNKWQSHIRHQGKRFFLGYYTTLDEARAAIDETRARLHGEFAISTSRRGWDERPIRTTQ